MPLVEKCITVDGSAVKEPKNVIAPIGTPIEFLLEAAGGCKSEPAKVLYGGPMMGIAVPSLSEPVLKNTNAIIAMDEKEKLYKAKKKEFSYDKDSDTVTFDSENLKGSRKLS